MKKKILTVFLAVAVSVTVAACGKQTTEKPDAGNAETTEESGNEQAAGETENQDTDRQEAAEEATEPGGYMKDLNAGDYVTLGDYKGIEVTLEEPEISDEYLDDYIAHLQQDNAVSKPVTDRPVEMGDVVNIDYLGKIDGEAFDGGSAEGYDLTIGSGRFIEGFEEGCIGMETGETRDVEAVFPDPYTNNPDLAGKTAVFTVTVNEISIKETPELTDEYVQSLSLDGCTNVEEYRAYVYDMLMEQQKESYESEKMELAYEKVVENCEFKDAPETMVSRLNNTLLLNVSSYAGRYGMDIGTYVSAAYGGAAEDYEQTLLEQSNMMAQRYLLMQAIADREGLSVSDEELEEQIALEAQNYGYETVEEYKSYVDMEAFREYLMAQKVLAFLGENAVVVPAQ